jgi:hypothetical protein
MPSFMAIYKFFAYHAFQIAMHFRQFPLKQIPNWHALNHVELLLLLSNQLQLVVMLKFFVQNVFQVAVFH